MISDDSSLRYHLKKNIILSVERLVTKLSLYYTVIHCYLQQLRKVLKLENCVLYKLSNRMFFPPIFPYSPPLDILGTYDKNRQ